MTLEFEAELRIYQPLRAFPDALQARLLQARKLTRDTVEGLAYRWSMRRVLHPNPFPSPGSEQIRVLRVPVIDQHSAGYSEFFCPDEMDYRTLLAAEDLIDALPVPLADTVLPAEHLEGHVRRIESQNLWRAQYSALHPATKTSAWRIPLAWFIFFDTEDPVTAGTHPVTQYPTIRITTPLRLAAERMRRASGILHLLNPDWEISQVTTEMIDWIEHFHEDSYLELDYGGLARFVWPDESIADVALALSAAEDRDVVTAGVAYQRFARRWMNIIRRASQN